MTLNVSNTELGTEEGLVVNLHPGFTIPEDQLHQDQVFPWLTHVNDIAEEQAKILGDFPGFSSLEEMQQFVCNLQSTLEGWQKIKKHGLLRFKRAGRSSESLPRKL